MKSRKRKMQTHSKVRRNPNHKFSYRLKKYFLFLFGLFLLGCFFQFLFSLDTLEIVNSEYYSDEQIREKLTTKFTDYNTLLFYIRYQFLEQNEIPFIQDMDIYYIDRHTIKVQVYEKAIIGCIKHMNEYSYFDKDGLIVEISSDKLKKIPDITGVHFTEVTLYQKIQFEEDIFQTVLNLSQLVSNYKLKIDTINFDQNQEVILQCKGIKILLGKKEIYDEQIAELSHILPEILKLDKKGTLDLRNFEEGQGFIPFQPE